MNANELRIGNLISRKNCIQEIKGIGLNAVTVDNLPPLNINKCISIPLRSINPIPLTEERLIDFGFKPRKYKHKIIWTNKINAVSVCMCVMNGEHFFMPETGYDIRFSPTLEYVHQLQNLYFALTGEELTIK